MSRVYLDTCVYIYHFEAHPDHAKNSGKYFSRAERGEIEIIASPLILQEIMAGVYSDPDSEHHATDLYGLLTSHPGIQWIPYTIEIADIGAKIRSICEIKTPDSIHLATAIVSNCSEFLTNDKSLLKTGPLNLIKLVKI